MAKFVPIPSNSQELNRIQHAVAKATSDVPSDTNSVSRVTSKTGTTFYSVKSTDKYVSVDARFGPVKLALPTLASPHTVTVVSTADVRNKITVTRSDRKPINGSASVTVPPLGSALFLFDGDWYHV